MNINTIFNNYLANGYSNLNAISKTCQDIILAQISNSSLNKNVTIKGGVVMMAISKDKKSNTRFRYRFYKIFSRWFSNRSIYRKIKW